MALLDYTTYDDIRAALGVSSDELSDATLSLAVYEYSLASEIRAISRQLASDAATVSAIDEGTRTATEQELVEVMSLFCTYTVARQLLPSLPLFSPKEQSDGKASLSRYSTDPYRETMKRVEQEYARFRADLQAVYADYKATSTTTSTPRVYMVVSSPSSDPVTGT